MAEGAPRRLRKYLSFQAKGVDTGSGVVGELPVTQMEYTSCGFTITVGKAEQAGAKTEVIVTRHLLFGPALSISGVGVEGVRISPSNPDHQRRTRRRRPQVEVNTELGLADVNGQVDLVATAGVDVGIVRGRGGLSTTIADTITVSGRGTADVQKGVRVRAHIHEGELRAGEGVHELIVDKGSAKIDGVVGIGAVTTEQGHIIAKHVIDKRGRRHRIVETG